MKVREIKDILEADVLAGEEYLDREVHTACGSDLMSDVLAYSKDQSVLLTGLCNPQVVRTAEMTDIICVVFVRSKHPDGSIIKMAEECGLILLQTDKLMFSSCGLLYAAGLPGGSYDE